MYIINKKFFYTETENAVICTNGNDSFKILMNNIEKNVFKCLIQGFLEKKDIGFRNIELLKKIGYLIESVEESNNTIQNENLFICYNKDLDGLKHLTMSDERFKNIIITDEETNKAYKIIITELGMVILKSEQKYNIIKTFVKHKQIAEKMTEFVGELLLNHFRSILLSDDSVNFISFKIFPHEMTSLNMDICSCEEIGQYYLASLTNKELVEKGFFMNLYLFDKKYYIFAGSETEAVLLFIILILKERDEVTTEVIKKINLIYEGEGREQRLLKLESEEIVMLKKICRTGAVKGNSRIDYYDKLNYRLAILGEMILKIV